MRKQWEDMLEATKALASSSTNAPSYSHLNGNFIWLLFFCHLFVRNNQSSKWNARWGQHFNLSKSRRKMHLVRYKCKYVVSSGRNFNLLKRALLGFVTQKTEKCCYVRMKWVLFCGRIFKENNNVAIVSEYHHHIVFATCSQYRNSLETE